MKSLVLALLVCALVGTALSCDKFQKYMEMFCKYPGESNMCLTSNALSYKASCCASKGGCNSREFPKDKYFIFRTKMQLFLLSLLYIGALAADPFLNTTYTLDLLNRAIEDLQAQSQYIPSYIIQPLLQSTEEEKQQYITFMNKIRDGQITVQNKDDWRQRMQEEAPGAAARFETIYNELAQRYDNLSQSAKDFVNKWVDQFVALIGNQNSKALLMQKVKEFFDAVQNLPPETVESFQQQFPELTSSVENWLSMQNLQDYMNNLPDDNGIYQDPQNVQQFMEKFNQVMPAGIFVV